MIRHYDKVVKQELSLIAIMEHDFDEQSRTLFCAENRGPFPGNGRNEKCALEIFHPGLVIMMRAIRS